MGLRKSRNTKTASLFCRGSYILRRPTAAGAVPAVAKRRQRSVVSIGCLRLNHHSIVLGFPPFHNQKSDKIQAIFSPKKEYPNNMIGRPSKLCANRSNSLCKHILFINYYVALHYLSFAHGCFIYIVGVLFFPAVRLCRFELGSEKTTFFTVPDAEIFLFGLVPSMMPFSTVKKIFK